MLDTVVSYYFLKFQRKLLNHTWQNGENSSFGTNLDPFGPNLGPKFFFDGLYFYYMLDIVESYHCMHFQGKLINQTWENGKKPSFRTHFGQNLDPRDCFVNFTSTTC